MVGEKRSMKGVPRREEEKTKVHLKAKKTESEWQRVLERFWKKVTPRWFEWLEWILILGVLQFVVEQTRSLILSIVCAFSYLALFFYLQGVFYSVEIYGFPWVKSERTRRMLSLIVSGILSYALWLLLIRLVSEIRGKV